MVLRASAGFQRSRKKRKKDDEKGPFKAAFNAVQQSNDDSGGVKKSAALQYLKGMYGYGS